MTTTIRARIDTELTRRVGKWFTVREIQDKLKINRATLKRLIMRYSAESVLRKRKIKGASRSVEFSPAGNSVNSFRQMLTNKMPQRNLGTTTKKATSKKTTTSKKKAKKATKKR